jgi:hypothetical protein
VTSADLCAALTSFAAGSRVWHEPKTIA